MHAGAVRARHSVAYVRVLWSCGCGGGVGMALSADAVVCGREDAIHLAERSDGLVEVQAERGEVVDRGLRHGPPRANGDDGESGAFGRAFSSNSGTGRATDGDRRPNPDSRRRRPNKQKERESQIEN